MEKLPEKRLEKFREIIEKLKENIAIILSHLDPDSIACAKLFSEICKHFEKKAKIFYAGGLHLPQNKIIWNKFGLEEDFSSIKKFLEIENKDQYSVVLLDSSSLDDPRLDGVEIKPTIIIDHHLSADKLEETDDTWYHLIVCGAAITLVVQLFIDLELKFEANDDLSTLGVLGILTDTGTMKLVSKNATHLDREAFTFLMRFADDSRIRDIFASVKDKRYLTLLCKATANIETEEDTIITNLGFIDIDDEVYAALLAEELCSIQGVNTVVVWALDEENTLYIKIRSVDDKIDMNNFIKKYFGKGSGGGRTGAGAARIPPPPHFYIARTGQSRELYMQFINRLILDAIFKSSSE